MSQLGMQLPGSQARRGGSMNVYTALLFVAVMCLAGALGMVWVQGTKVAPGGKPWEVHPSGQRLDLKALPGQ
ncbi:MAG: hypothetical protein AB7G17_10320 [Phycisphaerales bacterium]